MRVFKVGDAVCVQHSRNYWNTEGQGLGPFVVTGIIEADIDRSAHSQILEFAEMSPASGYWFDDTVECLWPETGDDLLIHQTSDFQRQETRICATLQPIIDPNSK